MPITDPSEQYFKDGGWSWDGSKWIKGGLAFEYASQVLGEVTTGTAAAGNNFLAGGAVPADYIWVITSMAVVDTVNGMSGARLGVLVGAVHKWAAMTGALAVRVGYSWAGQLILVEGDKPEAMCQGVTLNDDLYFYYFGYAMRLT